jgi:hypothetical protein
MSINTPYAKENSTRDVVRLARRKEESALKLATTTLRQ